jgi:hypothetical protein
LRETEKQYNDPGSLVSRFEEPKRKQPGNRDIQDPGQNRQYQETRFSIADSGGHKSVTQNVQDFGWDEYLGVIRVGNHGVAIAKQMIL